MSFIVGEIEVALLDASAPPPNPGYDPPLSVARLSHEADADKGTFPPSKQISYANPKTSAAPHRCRCARARGTRGCARASARAAACAATRMAERAAAHVPPPSEEPLTMNLPVGDQAVGDR